MRFPLRLLDGFPLRRCSVGFMIALLTFFSSNRLLATWKEDHKANSKESIESERSTDQVDLKDRGRISSLY